MQLPFKFSPLKKKAIIGAMWTVGSYGFGQVLRFVSNLILARLLFPDLFGLMALVGVFIMGLSLFSDIGIGPSIIRSERGDEPSFLNTAWTIQVLRGLVVWAGTLVIAYPVSLIYNYPQLLWLIPLVGFTSVISGFTSTAVITLNRKMDLKQLTIFEVLCQILSLVVTVVWAWVHPSIWALVGGNVFSTVIRTVGSFFLRPRVRNRFEWNRDVLKEILKFGKWIFISTALTFVSMQVDRLILGRVFSLELFGIFTIAYTLSDVPRQVIGVLGDKILFPAAAQFSHLPRPEFREKLLKNRRWLLLMIAAGLAVLVCFGDLLIQLLYDKRYDQAVWMFPLLALGIWPIALEHTMDIALFAIGRIQSLTVGHVLKIAFNVVCIPLAYTYAGIPGALIAIAMSNIPYYLAVTVGSHLEGIADLWQDLRATAIFCGMIGVLLLIRFAIGIGSPLAGMG